MKNFHKLLIVFIVTGAGIQQAAAQLQINFLPAIYGKSLDGISFFQVTNQTGSDFNCAVRIIVNEEKAGKVAEINANSIYVKRGLNSYNRSLLAGSKTKFSSSPVADIMRQTGRLPEGDYEYCYELTPIDVKPGVQDLYENCFHFNLQPVTPLLLVDPIDGEKNCNQKPAFVWQPPMPVDFNARFRVVVVEIRDKQNAIEALSFNQPLINVAELRQPRMNYPMNIKELEKGKTYAWQVTYSINNMLVNKSEIWTFTIDCEEEPAKASDDSYRELKPGVSGDYYIAQGKLKFAVTNSYNEGDLAYTIVSLEEPEKPIQHLPKLKFMTGLNKYELNLAEYRVFKSGKQYELAIRLMNGQRLTLRFTYQD